MRRRPRSPVVAAEPRCPAVQSSDQGLNAGFPALRRLDREVFPVLAVLFCACLGFAFGAGTVGSDSWLDLVAGRLVVHDGLPHHDTLTAWAFGRRWVDQQWLAQVGLYALFALGGLGLLVLSTLAATMTCVGALVALARRRGATATSTAIVTIPLFFLVLPAADVRAQTFAYPLFAAVLWLIWGAPDGASALRLAFTLPVLVAWANVHGSVLLGAVLVVLAAVEAAFRRRDPRLLAFVAAALAAVFASPYSFELPRYYRTVLWNPAFGKLVTEWRAPTLANHTLFWVVAVLSIALVVLRRRQFAPSELVAFALIAAGAFHAIRNIVWFALIALVMVPRTFAVTSTTRRQTRLNAALTAAALAVTGAFALSVALRSDAALSRSYPAPALAAVQGAAGGRPIWADDRYADWLLYKTPSARGRVLFDARFELLTQRELTDISRFRVRGVGALVVPPSASKAVACAGGRVVYRDERVLVAALSGGARTAAHRHC